MFRNGIHLYLFCSISAIIFASPGTTFQANAQEPAFEVATVKPVLRDAAHPFNPRHFGPHISPASASYWSMTPDSLFAYAYAVDLTQVSGPEWANRDSFDIEARFPEGSGEKEEPRMLQALLKDRFKVAFHIEKRELERYVLIVGKQPQKLRPSLPDPANSETDAPLKPVGNNPAEQSSPSKTTRNQDGSSTVDMGKRGTRTTKYDQERRVLRFEFSKVTMAELAQSLRACFWGVPNVVDETGIEGTYQVAYECPPPMPALAPATGATGALPSDQPDDSSLTRSLNALGLKLEKRKVAMDVYVIDHVEKPSEN